MAMVMRIASARLHSPTACHIRRATEGGGDFLPARARENQPMIPESAKGTA